MNSSGVAGAQASAPTAPRSFETARTTLRRRLLRELREGHPRLALFLQSLRGRFSKSLRARDESRLDEVRAEYYDLIDALRKSGELERAVECTELAIRHGIWRDVQRTPRHFIASIPDRCIYDKTQFWFVDLLEKSHRVIREELDAITEPRRAGFKGVKEEDLVGSGGWDELVFFEGGHRFERACRLLPRTADLLLRIPELVSGPGAVALSWLQPGTHIRPHCGPTNAVLRGHLGIRVPEDCCMRLRDQTVRWREGQCVIFDHSYEHEVWNRSERPRVVLLFDMFHPSLSERQRQALPPEHVSLHGALESILRSRGIREIERSGASFAIRPDQRVEGLIARYFDDLAIDRASLASGKLELQPCAADELPDRAMQDSKSTPNPP